MKTYTTKIAKNGATLYYSVETGKRIAKNIALENEENYIITNGTIAERYDLANKYYRVNLNGEIEKDGHYTTIGYGKNGAYYTGSNGWHVISNNCALIDLKRNYNITLDEFIAEYTKRHAAEVSEEIADTKLAELKKERADAYAFKAKLEDSLAESQVAWENIPEDVEVDAAEIEEDKIYEESMLEEIANVTKTIERINKEIDDINNAAEENADSNAGEVSEETADNTVTFYPTTEPKPCTGKLFGYDYCEYHSVEEYISELELTQIAVIMENLFKNADGTYSYDGWGRKTYYMTDCYREAYYGGGYYNEITLDAESTAQLIYVEQQLKNIVNGSDGSEEDIDGDNVFDYLPALDELNDVDIDDDDNTPPDNEPMSDDIDDICNLTPEWRIYRTEDDDIVEKLTVNGEELTFINGAPNHIHSDTYKAGFSYFSCKFYSTDKKYKTIHEEEEFFAIMANRGACTIEPDEPEPAAMSDICKRTSEVDPAEHAINAEEYAREIPQHNPCSQIKQFFIGDTENHRAELVTFEGDRWEIIKSNYYGAEMYNGTDNKIHFIVGEFYDDTTGKYFPEPERGMNTTDAEEFFAIMADRGACTIDDDNTPPVVDPPANDQQAKKEIARKITAKLNAHNEQRLKAGFNPIIPYASRDAHYHKLHGAAKWTVAYDSVNDTFGIWSEYGWHESGFSLGHEFCGWYKIAGLAVIISRLTNAIDYAHSEFYFEPVLQGYDKWQAVRADHPKDKIDRDAQASEEIAG